MATYAEQRNEAIARFILNTNDYEFINFVPNGIAGLPDSVTFGESYPFEISGDLTIRDITQEVVFQATITPVSADRLEGTASTTINRADYDLNITNVPFVANVEEEVLLAIDFVATSVT